MFLVSEFLESVGVNVMCKCFYRWFDSLNPGDREQAVVLRQELKKLQDPYSRMLQGIVIVLILLIICMAIYVQVFSPSIEAMLWITVSMFPGSIIFLVVAITIMEHLWIRPHNEVQTAGIKSRASVPDTGHVLKDLLWYGVPGADTYSALEKKIPVWPC